MGSLVKNIIRFFLFVLFQAFVLDKIRLHQMITPYVYFLFLLWLPFYMNRTLQMLVGFLLGYALDSFRHQPGFNAAACVMIAYIRPFLINVLMPQEGADTNFSEPSIRSMGGVMSYLVYVTILCFIHNAWLFFLEAWHFSDAWYFLVKTFFSTIISVVLIMLTEMIFSRNQKFRTNTA